MQMYLWGVSVWRISIEPTSNTDLLGTYASTRFPFIPIPREEDDSINSALVLVERYGLSGLNHSPRCTSKTLILGMDVQLIQLQVRLQLKVKLPLSSVVIPFVDKITIAQDNGAIGVIIINNVPAGAL
jgi:hypothetical protein